MGDALGLVDGLAEGDVDGELLGRGEGDTVGLVDGELVGDLVGGAMIVTTFSLCVRESTFVVTVASASTFCFSAFSLIVAVRFPL